MAHKVHVQLTDDIDGGEATQTVPFSLDGVAYEIDLSDENAGELRDGLAQFVSAGRRIGAGSSRSPVDREKAGVIRAWARANGYRIANRGRISARVTAAFAAAEAALAPRKN